MRSAIFFLSLFSTLQAIAASDCGPEIRLDQKQADGRDGAMMQVPVLDQRTMPICYAYVLSETTQGWLSTHGNASFHPSPVVIALDATSLDPSAKNFGSLATGRNASVAFNAILQKGLGFCSVEAWPKGITNEEQFLTGLETAFDHYHAQLLAEEKRKASLPAGVKEVHLGNAPTLTDALRGDAQEAQKCFLNSGLDEKQKLTLVQIEEALKKDSPLAAMKMLLTPGCYSGDSDPSQLKTRFHPEMPEMTFTSIVSAGDEKTAGHLLDQKLLHNEPIIISMDTKIFSMRRTDPVTKSYGHFVVIIGKRRGPSGACQYLLRNSWGTACPADLSPDWECQKDEHGNPTGSLWLDSDFLLKSSQEIDYFK